MGNFVFSLIHLYNLLAILVEAGNINQNVYHMCIIFLLKVDCNEVKQNKIYETNARVYLKWPSIGYAVSVLAFLDAGVSSVCSLRVRGFFMV